MASLASISWWHCSNFDSVPPLRILVLLQVDRLIVLSSIIRHAPPPPPGPLGPNPKLLKPSAILHHQRSAVRWPRGAVTCPRR